jgi:hypothetical protein
VARGQRNAGENGRGGSDSKATMMVADDHQIAPGQ